ncbi:hypothetical protein OG894_13185 [Streptomyces sp. NBC_01724]|uniref:hypothetical protein n=1 Tax=unclassified Streptomyces TaxID=2593676 RepID=UPI0028C4112F|nr:MULTISPECIES: hypothetical protein [unclassified Streptomyces]WNO67578.1 hypothetical protein RPQ02_29060 [Streptomyces sp. AM2-3-1]WTE54468.1 hypothetical protein OG987_29190 [Streptomyces sp. NBC_01620]WTE62598.1 hypothetical protein OG784_29415 [Streptomyces sp. NBC_01617]WTI89975.1 hypothetical protein OHB17_29220 [Streptomyces sp. NBC_00724]
MPLIPEEPQIHESAQGPRVAPATGRTAPTPRPVPGPRSAATPRPGRPGPGPARPAPPAQRPHPTAGQSQAARSENRSVPQIQLIPASAGGALDAADEAVDLLLDSGRAPGDILVLTTGEHHPWAAHELSFGEAAYWAQHEAGEDVFFAGAEGADRVQARPVVIVAVNGAADDAAARALLLAQKRAGTLLIVCGDPQQINTVLGVGV